VSGVIETLGRCHPALVHFPVALVVTAMLAELMFIGKKVARYTEAARFMLAAAALASIPTAVAGFAAAAGEVFPAGLQSAFTIHRIAGIAVPVLIVLAYALCEGARRSGQVWEQGLYRFFLYLATAVVLVAGYFGGLLVHSPQI
jgi:uncharacterized membrane protein